MMFEGLESRTLMAAYTWSPFLDAPAPIIGGNDGHSILFTRYAKDGGTYAWLQQAKIDGQWTRVSDLPGFGPGALLIDADSSGRLLGFEPFGTDPAPFFVIAGVRQTLAETVTSWVGQTGNSSKIRVADIVDNGWSLVTESDSSRVWRLKDGVATFVGEFEATINSLGTIMPRFSPSTPAVPRALFLADGTQSQIPEIMPGAILGRDSNTVVWEARDTTNTHSILTVWRDGLITHTDLPALFGSPTLPGWRPLDVADDGRVVLHLIHSFQTGLSKTLYVIEPPAGLRSIEDILWTTAPLGGSNFPGETLYLAGDGAIVTATGLLTPIAEEEAWTALDGTPITAAAAPGSSIAGGVNKFGDPVVLVRTGGVWDGFRVSGVDRDLPPSVPKPRIDRVLAYIDPVDGSPHVFITTPDAMLWGTLPTPLQLQTSPFHRLYVSRPFGPSGATPALHNLALFESIDHRVHLTGTNADGDLVLFYTQDGSAPGAPDKWNFANLTSDHLEANGKTFTPVSSGLTAFVAPWGASHITYLDSAGDVQVVWWAPGLTYWTTDNLSRIAGAAPLHGSLTSYVTPWSGLNIAGTDADGHLVALWWVPQFGSVWKYERYAGDSAAKLDADSLTSFVTPWGSLNVVGLDATTRAITVYWWTPATNEWWVEPIAVAGGASSITARSAPVAATPTPDGLLQIYFTGEDLHMDRLYWTPDDGAAWNFEDVSAAV